MEQKNVALEEALSYASAGWHVMPLEPYSHVPRRGCVASLDAKQITQWWVDEPAANVGAALGLIGSHKSGICILRIDENAQVDAANEMAAAAGQKYQMTGHFSDGKSRFWVFALTDHMRSEEIAPGINIYTDGVVPMPPSVVGTNNQLKWKEDKHLRNKPVTHVPREILSKIESLRSKQKSNEPAVSIDWRLELARDKHGVVTNTFGNVCIVLRWSETYKGTLSYDEMRLAESHEGQPITDAVVGKIRERLEREFRMCVGEAIVRHAIVTVANETKFHPVRDYLNSLKWDGMPRISRVADEVLGIAEPTDLQKTILRKWFVSAAVRGLTKEAVKVDTVLVFLGEQGAMKSSFFSVLGGKWFSDTYMDIAQKDAMMQLTATWIYEWGEVEKVVAKKESEEVKGFLTSQEDSFRAPYDKSVRKVYRTSVIVGTTNKEKFLSDSSGSRRFWVIKISGKVNLDKLRLWRDQLWAEAVDILRTSKEDEKWWLNEQEEQQRKSSAEDYHEEDPWEPAVKYWIDNHTNEYFSVNQIMDGLLLPIKDRGMSAAKRIGFITQRLGMVHSRYPYSDARLPELARCWRNPNFVPKCTDDSAASSAASPQADEAGKLPPGHSDVGFN